ncbi:MAG: class I SAM-dependent methyltransferase [Xanthomonadales bacterium]|nr:Tuberculostearic acid methyltransferase UfaA1 [Xanthomonadales bacterium]MCC6594682.1 class I SAM-dependent methyltransferase [Xanthomonadales bacterium]MCE7932235.1 class I SAM-dependent methyltransferase [Xanthomonadales bacterium PRO6]
MTEHTLAADRPLAPTTLAEISGPFFKRRVLAQLTRLREGHLSLVDGSERYEFGAVGQTSDLRATVRVHADEVYRQMALGGSVGSAEAFMDGAWDADDLVALVRILVRNRAVLDGMEGGPARFFTAALRLWHSRRRNTREGSRRNIAAHYDLGNEFFALFLDESLMYSSAIFVDPAESLEVAQQRRLRRICSKLDLKPGERVLEIGTGWGGFAIHAAREHGVHVTTTTISRRQYELARERVARAGLADRITLLLQDYRELRGEYDKLVSIEMIEAIGHQYLDTYFERVGALLAPHGAALIQAITIEDHRYERALKDIDFIKRYIFPGSFIPCNAAMLGAVARSSDLRLTHLEDIGPSYALTLRAWRERFLARLPEVRAQGYSEAFVRMWEYYLCYCEGGFLERSIGDVQMLLQKPDNRRAQYLPDLEPRI